MQLLVSVESKVNNAQLLVSVEPVWSCCKFLVPNLGYWPEMCGGL